MFYGAGGIGKGEGFFFGIVVQLSKNDSCCKGIACSDAVYDVGNFDGLAGEQVFSVPHTGFDLVP
ncbi:hypothetical protein D3C86_1400070 [compost metagenome]